MKRVLVAGATGYLGRHLVAALKQQGCWVRALVRRPEQGAALAGADHLFVGQVTAPEMLRGLAEGIDTAFSTIGITRQRDGLTYEQVDYGGNLALLRACEQAGVERFAYVAILHGPQMRQVRLIDAKERFVDALVASPVAHTVVRPTGFFSDMRAFVDMARRGRVYLVGDGAARINPISGPDLAQACIEGVRAGRAEVEVGGPETFSYRELAELAGQAAGRKVRITALPVGLLRGATRPLEWLAPMTYGPLEFFRAVATRDMVAPSFGAERLLDFFRAGQASA